MAALVTSSAAGDNRPHPVRPWSAPRSRIPRLLVGLAVVAAWVSLRAQSEPPLLNVTTVPPEGDPNDFFWWAERTDPVRFTNASSTHYFLSDPTVPRTTTFFPPDPPALDGEIPLGGSFVPGAPPAPAELAAHVADPFYPMLGSGLFAADLPAALTSRLAEYRDEKARLETELREFLAATHDGAGGPGARDYAAFAEKQSPRIAALEARAETLRRDLQRRYPLSRGRGAPLGGRAPTDPESVRRNQRQLEADVLQVAAYYQDGLSAEQRALLRASARESARAARGEPPGPWLDFSPQLARLRLPEDLPPLLRQHVEDYTALKRELMDGQRNIVLDRNLHSRARTEQLREFWTREAKRLAALEALAEEIRRGLAARPTAAAAAAVPTLPPELAARVAAYRRHKTEALQRLHAALQEGKNTAASDGNDVKAFNRLQERLLGDLTRELSEIRQALGSFVAGQGGARDRKSIDDLLRDFETARQLQENSARFRDYRTAMLLPGLSPGQRRLLFATAVEQLALPLPPGQRVR